MSDNVKRSLKKKSFDPIVDYHKATLFKFVEYAINMLEYSGPRNSRYRKYLERIGLNPIKEEIEDIFCAESEDYIKTTKESINRGEKEKVHPIKKSLQNSFDTINKVKMNTRNVSVKNPEEGLINIADSSPKIISLERKRNASMPKHLRIRLMQYFCDRKNIRNRLAQNKMTPNCCIQGMRSLQSQQMLQLADDLRKTVIRESKQPKRTEASSNRNTDLWSSLNNHCDENLKLPFKEKIRLFNKIAEEQVSHKVNADKNHQKFLKEKNPRAPNPEKHHQFGKQHTKEITIKSIKSFSSCDQKRTSYSTFPRALKTQQENSSIVFSRTLPKKLTLTNERSPKTATKQELFYEIEFLEVAQCTNGLIPVKMRVKRFDAGKSTTKKINIQEKENVPPKASVRSLIEAFERKCQS